MHHYPHHIGDFNAATRHLTRVERSVYRDAIELYYDTENILTGDIDKLGKRLLCVNEEEKTALNDILSEFFTQTDDGYFHNRCDSEIEKYKANSSAKARAGKASAEARKKKKASKKKPKPAEPQQNSTGVEQVLNTASTEAQRNSTNQEPRTKNQEPVIPPSGGTQFPPPDNRERKVDDWQPSNEAFDALKTINACPEKFIIEQVVEFKLYWRDRGESHVSWDSKFIKSCAGQWKKHGHDWQENPDLKNKSTRNRSLGDDLNDRSWGNE